MKSKILLFSMLLISLGMSAQIISNKSEENIDNWPERIYDLTIGYETVNYTGKDVKAMSFNGSIPGPTLEFNEGEFAIINVTNTMDEETSVHWHGLILPNFYDGVPYLTTPPIKPGETQQYKFALKQSGTYWYHSHTGLQEQRGVYGSIQINPKQTDLEYDKDLVLVLSDWMDENPKSQLRNLKRGNEWYLIKKNQIQSWDKVIARGATGAKLKMMWQRMPDMAILDNYYDLFFINGQAEQNYPEFEPGERVRVRFVNAAAATYFWLTFGGEDPMLVSSDGLDVVPVKKNKTLIGVAETYDFIVTIPENGKLEIRATSQDGSGQSSAFLGSGEVLSAPEVSKPDLIKQMTKMMAMDMKMGAPAIKFNPSKNNSIKKMKKYAMKMDGMQMDMQKDNMKEMTKDSTNMKHNGMAHDHMQMKDDKIDMNGGMDMGYVIPKEKVIGDNMKTGGNPEFSYNYLRAPENTEFEDDKPIREMLFNLTGNMNRYVWSINGVPLSETDKIKIQKGEVVRITLNNMTMMHHPMHLHGHFFRVLNENGKYSPLKHTVNVAPMQKVVIEFDANESDDWFFHCHILYHVNSGMARVFSYDTPRDKRLKNYPLSNLTNEANHMFTWGEVTGASHMTELYYTATNLRNQFTLRGEYGWNENLEAEFTYERWLNSYFRVFGGVNVENEMKDSLDEISTTGVVGVRYLLPLLIDSDLRIDNKLRPTISFSTATMLTRHIALYGEYEYQMDFGWINDFEAGTDFEEETTWQVGLEYVLSRNFSLMGSYDNRFGWGGGLSARF
ncbi:multicopper oxidase domain-containing protein [Zobellia galactanivorans]|uniref:multicopper oxidase domain-containing protein n=1 Tax=Zobellia galactanivorans (strain DSM 12802 / CCUG 47099 / CIP 106680 / NCIMB 13871 / Dsij) TaxID=63186 RepID=UPI001C074AAB|nr:multicopper oxidase domain-containing protein [Zobellia galactanivorans]MBU3026078.1 multicopper oxidase domain-containing protein [Zobellia galactanivorans]